MNEYEQFLHNVAYGIEHWYWIAYLDDDGDVCLITTSQATIWHYDNALTATEALCRMIAVDRAALM